MWKTVEFIFILDRFFQLFSLDARFSFSASLLKILRAMGHIVLPILRCSKWPSLSRVNGCFLNIMHFHVHCRYSSVCVNMSHFFHWRLKKWVTFYFDVPVRIEKIKHVILILPSHTISERFSGFDSQSPMSTYITFICCKATPLLNKIKGALQLA